MTPTRTLVLLLPLSLAACEPRETTPPSAQAASAQTAPEANAEPPKAGSPNAELAPAPAGDGPDPAPSGAFTATPADAASLCAQVVDDEEIQILRCAFVDGVALDGGGRIDVLELAFDEEMQGETTQVHVILRVDAYPTIEEVGSAFDVPGQSDSYELGKLTVNGATAQFEAELVTTYYGNTGDPDADPEETHEKAKAIITCTISPLEDAGCETEMVEHD